MSRSLEISLYLADYHRAICHRPPWEIYHAHKLNPVRMCAWHGALPAQSVHTTLALHTSTDRRIDQWAIDSLSSTCNRCHRDLCELRDFVHSFFPIPEGYSSDWPHGVIIKKEGISRLYSTVSFFCEQCLYRYKAVLFRTGNLWNMNGCSRRDTT